VASIVCDCVRLSLDNEIDRAFLRARRGIAGGLGEHVTPARLQAEHGCLPSHLIFRSLQRLQECPLGGRSRSILGVLILH
jgi:hypothetical protein